MKKLVIIILIFVAGKSYAQKWSQELANTVMRTWPDSFLLEGDKAAKWRYDQGVILKGMEGIWRSTGDQKWFDYIRKSMDVYVQEDGTIRGYRHDEYNIDHINNGRVLLFLYRETGKEKYRKAAQLLRGQLTTHPRTSEGGFWHKKIYPWQMWLDGLYMGEPFYAEYAKLFQEDTAFNDITRQFILMERHARDPKTGLLYHGWDESKQQKWADKTTGRSPHVWGRALGWYGMAMVDVLDHFPQKHLGRDSITRILNRFVKAIVSVQDAKTGLWYDIVDKPKEPKNYFEASASSMLVYTLAKAVRKGYIPASYLTYAKKGYNGILKQFIKTENGQVNLHGTVSVSGLGGNPYRDGSFSYYMSEPVIVNDPKGMGAFIHAAVEMEMLPEVKNSKTSSKLKIQNSQPDFLTVDQSGKGDFRSIQAALNSLSKGSFSTRTIFIKNGVYDEKIYIEKSNIVLQGESREKTIITQAIARDEWRCGHMDDWGVATLNVDGDDITLQNLTITNSFGFDWKEDKTIICPSDTLSGKRVLTKSGHQMALRTLNGNRLKAINCHFKAFGGDTVSPWDVRNGMFYFKDCIMEGGVDFYCPRGWAWAENCHFISHSGTAAIWHDGSANADSKTILKNCSFEGFDGFNLGRYHRDAQFFLVDCRFPKNMADRDIYLVPTNNIIQWGRRVYYYNCHRDGGDYSWHANNLPAHLTADQITVLWLFDGRWNPVFNDHTVSHQVNSK